MKQIDFENGKITDNILKAALPMLVAQILSLLYNIVDRIYIARIPDIGTTALGAVGLCFPIIVIITAFSNLFGSGGAPLFSIERGKGDHENACQIMHTSFSMLTLCSILLMLTGLIFAKPILTLFGAGRENFDYACPYLMIYLLGTFPSMVATGMNPFINAQGYATTGMISVVIGAVANLILDPIFIFAFGMGIRGAAIATVISQILSAAFVLHFLLCKAEYKVRLLHREEIRASSKYAKNIISLGTAGFIMQLTNSLVTICCNHVLSVTGGTLYISVMTIISSVRQVVETPIYAITEFLISIFSSDKSLLADAVPAMKLYFGAFIFMLLQYIGQTIFKSLNKKKQAIFFSLLRKVIIVIPITYLLPYAFHMGTDGVFLAEPISNIIGSSLCFLVMIISIRKELRE